MYHLFSHEKPYKILLASHQKPKAYLLFNEIEISTLLIFALKLSFFFLFVFFSFLFASFYIAICKSNSFLNKRKIGFTGRKGFFFFFKLIDKKWILFLLFISDNSYYICISISHAEHSNYYKNRCSTGNTK